ncbi:MAG TPA: hypothetical protein VNO52_10745, partial [Methylomirabilota bacterium]|nr:hypothetical protein [Methylomirabilota bacterium]
GFVPASFTDTLVPVAASTSGASSGATVGTATSSGTIFYGTIALGTPAVSTAYSNRLREVTVTLAWTNGGLVRTREMKTFVGQNGLQQYIY